MERTIEDYLDDYLDDIHARTMNSSLETYRTYKRNSKYLLSYYHRNKLIYVNELKIKQLNNFIIEQKKLGVGSKTINERIFVFKRAFNYCIDIEELRENPIGNWRPLKVDRRLQLKKSVIPRDELLKIQDWIHKQYNIIIHGERFEKDLIMYTIRNYLIVSLLIDTGIRRKELIELDIEDFDLKNSIIYLPGKKSKSGRSRFMPYDIAINKVLKKYFTLFELEGSNPLLFTKKGKRIHMNIIGKTTSKLYDLGIDSSIRLNPHSFRHTNITYRLESGEVMTSVMTTVGHSSSETTKVYIDHSKEFLIEQNLKHSLLKKRKGH